MSIVNFALRRLAAKSAVANPIGALNSLLDLDFIVIVKARADHLNIHGSNNNITVSDGSNVDIEFRT